MNEWGRLVVYVILAFIGAVAHYFKKRYIEGTIEVSLIDYIFINKQATFNTLTACFVVAYGYTFSETEVFALSTVVGALTGGYVADSGLNKANI